MVLIRNLTACLIGSSCGSLVFHFPSLDREAGGGQRALDGISI